MTWQSRYLPPETSCWQGRSDLPPQSSFFQMIKLCDLQRTLPEPVTSPTFALIGFASDEGIRRNQGRLGAREAPYFIRAHLAKLSIEKNWRGSCYDVGDITCIDQDLEAAQIGLGEVITQLLALNMTPIVLGGGHEVAFGHYQGIVNHDEKATLGIVNFDAHFDMRPLLNNNKGSSGTPFLQMANVSQSRQSPFHYYCLGIQKAANMPLLFETAKEYKVQYMLAEEIYMAQERVQALIQTALRQNDRIYVSICLDVFASAVAPGVSAPQVLGLLPWQVIRYVRELAQSGKIISYDIAELSPTHDIDFRTAKLAAHLIHEIITHHITT